MQVHHPAAPPQWVPHPDEEWVGLPPKFAEQPAQPAISTERESKRPSKLRGIVPVIRPPLTNCRCASRVHQKFPLSKSGHRPPKRGLCVVAIRRANCLHKTHQAVTGKEYGVRYANKATVLGMLDRESRQVRARAVRDTKRETLQKEIMKNVKFGSRVYTDMAVADDHLEWKYLHDAVNHGDTYVKGQVPHEWPRELLVANEAQPERHLRFSRAAPSGSLLG